MCAYKLLYAHEWRRANIHTRAHSAHKDKKLNRSGTHGKTLVKIKGRIKCQKKKAIYQGRFRSPLVFAAAAFAPLAHHHHHCCCRRRHRNTATATVTAAAVATEIRTARCCVVAPSPSPRAGAALFVGAIAAFAAAIVTTALAAAALAAATSLAARHAKCRLDGIPAFWAAVVARFLGGVCFCEAAVLGAAATLPWAFFAAASSNGNSRTTGASVCHAHRLPEAIRIRANEWRI